MTSLIGRPLERVVYLFFKGILMFVRQNGFLSSMEAPEHLFDVTPILDHGYMHLVDHWGHDERIVEAARMSTNKGFVSWEPYIDHPRGDFGLLDYLQKHKHGTPFEMAGMTLVTQSPILVFREWHRHRTQCVSPTTKVHFNAPKSRDNRKCVYKLSIEDIHKKWQPTERKERNSRQSNAFWPRSRIEQMGIRNLNEQSLDIGQSGITDAIKGDPKPMVRIVSKSGKEIITSKDHQFFTNKGWLSLKDMLNSKAQPCVEGVASGLEKSWEVTDHDWASETWMPVKDWPYEVSSEGQVRQCGEIMPKLPTISKDGYEIVQLAYKGKSKAAQVHRLVLDAFKGERPEGMECRHLNSNRRDNRLENLAWGTAKENAQDRITSDRQQRLRSVFEEIVSATDVGMQDSYDISVDGPFHNFVANGFVVHNSYNEMSARYTPLPNTNYIPSVERLMMNANVKNKQARTANGVDLTEEKAEMFRKLLGLRYDKDEADYQQALADGVPKELARVLLPVGRYSRMMASGNLRNWLAFLTLRMDPTAQWEIRQFANQVGKYVETLFPKTWELFCLRK